MWRLTPILVLLLTAAVLITVRFSRLDTRQAADFSFINRGDHITLDTNSMSWLQDIRVAYAIWEGLYTLDPEKLEPVLGVADSVDKSPDGCVYTFHIRSDALWSNGKPVRSDDFIFAWRRMLEQPAEYIALFYYIKGARDYQQAYAKWTGQPRDKAPPPDFAKVGIERLDESRLRVTLEHPLSFFPSLCAFPPYFPQYEPCMHDYAHYDPRTGRIDSYDQHFTRPPNLVTNGPYMLTQWSFKRRLRLEASPYYWDRAHVRSKIIDEYQIEDPVSALRAYEDHQVDWLADVPGDLAYDLHKQGRSDLHPFGGFGTFFLSLNCLEKLPDGRINPLHDVRVRRALAISIDKSPVVNNLTRMGEPIATHYIPPGIFDGYASPPGQEYNVDQARRLLAAAGYPDGHDFPSLAILFNTENETRKEIAELLHNQWKQNLGIDLEVQGIEVNTFRDRLHKHDYAIATTTWIGDYPDPSTFTDKYLSDSDNNDSGWASDKFDQLGRQAVRQKDSAQEMRLFAEAEKILLDEVPIIPVYHFTNAYMFRDNVHGIPLDVRDMIMLKSVWVTRP